MRDVAMRHTYRQLSEYSFQTYLPIELMAGTRYAKRPLLFETSILENPSLYPIVGAY